MAEMLSDETFADSLVGFTIPSRNARGRLVRLDALIDEVLAAHDYPAPVALLLGEALVLVALLGGLVKEDGAQLTMQAQATGGPVNLLVCDFRGGAVRGYVDHDAAMLREVGANPDLKALFGEGHFALTYDLASKGRYQGIVPLEGDSLAAVCENYFAQSEQVPTMLRVAIEGEGGRYRAAGMLVQHLSEGEEGRERLHVKFDHPEWEHVAHLAGSIRHEELLDGNLSMEALVWRLFHEEEEVRMLAGTDLFRGCRCSKTHYEEVLLRFPCAERDDMRDEDGVIRVDCAFCSRQFEVAA